MTCLLSEDVISMCFSGSILDFWRVLQLVGRFCRMPLQKIHFLGMVKKHINIMVNECEIYLCMNHESVFLCFAGASNACFSNLFTQSSWVQTAPLRDADIF